ncbi:MAG TPA: hypothetical protein PK299_01240 [Anaerolineales bacterium]|nr:hypothetical protein [Anaerolineales bacterium]
MSRNALRLYKTAEFARIDAKISLTHSYYVLFRHPILHAVALHPFVQIFPNAHFSGKI